MMIDGTLCVTAQELGEFAAPALSEFGPIAPHLWLIELATGATKVVRSSDIVSLPEGWALLMTGPDPDWVAQWGGDWQRACDEQLNPMLSQSVTSPEEEQ